MVCALVKVIPKSANYTRDRSGHIEIVPHVLCGFLMNIHWNGDECHLLDRSVSFLNLLFILCFSHCEACVISFLVIE